MPGKIGDLGYCIIGKQSSDDVAVTPGTAVPLVSKDIFSELNHDDQVSIIGNRSLRQALIPGQRGHQGSMECLAEPNSLVYLLSMLMKRGTVSGADPYTHPFTVDEPAESWTIEYDVNSVVQRYWGVKAGNMSVSFDSNKMHVNMDVSALGSFITREIESVTGSSTPWTINLKTNYDPSPTKGLVADDIMSGFDVSDGTKTDFTVASVVDATSITTTTDVSALEAGDIIYLRPQTITKSFADPFTFARTEFRFGASAAAALSAAALPGRNGSDWSIDFPFTDDAGDLSSGSYDPIALYKGLADMEINFITTFMRSAAEGPQDLNRYLTTAGRSLVLRHFSGADHELRITIDEVYFRENPINITSGELVISEGVLVPAHNDSNDRLFEISLINGVSSV